MLKIHLKLSEMIYSRVYLLSIRVYCTTTPWISWNCKNFCFRCCCSTSCERLAAVISQAKDTFMRIGSRLWWREIGSVKSEKIVEPCCLTKCSSHLWQVLSYPYEKQRRTNSSLFETNVLHAPKYISKPMSPIIFIEQFSILLNYLFIFMGYHGREITIISGKDCEWGLVMILNRSEVWS